MELGGENLRTLIQRVSALGSGRAGPGTFIHPTIRREVWRQMVSIVGTLHSHNVVHMDLKPDNLILFGRTLKIGDLGISKKANMLQ
jgi:serine/threonine protein kinase